MPGAEGWPNEEALRTMPGANANSSGVLTGSGVTDLDAEIVRATAFGGLIGRTLGRQEESTMSYVSCPHCGTHCTPTPEGICPSCNRSTTAFISARSHAGEPKAAAMVTTRDGSASQFRILSHILGCTWIISGIWWLLFFGGVFPFGRLGVNLWGLTWLLLGLLVCLKHVWAVRIGLLFSYLLIPHYFFGFGRFPWWVVPPIILSHCVINRFRRMRTRQSYSAAPSSTTGGASAEEPDAANRATEASAPLDDSSETPATPDAGFQTASQKVQPTPIARAAVQQAEETQESAVADGGEITPTAAQSSSSPLPAILVSGVILTAMGISVFLLSPSAFTRPSDEFQQFAGRVETRLHAPRAGFVFGKVTTNAMQINGWHAGVIRVEATRQSDQAVADFTFRYAYEAGRWILTDAEVSGDETVEDSAETELAKGKASELLAIFSPSNAPRSTFYRNQARDWSEKGEHDKAIVYWNEVLRVEPRDTEAHRLRGIALICQSEYGKAVEDFDHVLRLEPETAFAYYGRGLAWGGMRKYDKAIEECNEALRLDPNDAIAWGARASVWLDKKDYDKAIDDADKCLELDPSFAIAYAIRGKARFLNHEDYEKAIEDCRKAIQLDPDEGWGYSALASIQSACPDQRYRDGTKAIENANQARQRIEADDISQWSFVDTLAAAYAEDGQFDKAAEWQQRAIELLAEDQYATDEEEEELRSRLMLYTQGKPYREQRGSP